MAVIRYLTHPQVAIDPAVPVPQWGLSPVGSARVEDFVIRRALNGLCAVVTSAETKAVETAIPIARSLDCPLIVREAMHENDRSATGFLPPAEFETMADLFFAHPEQSVRGWETASAAQRRIVDETEQVLTELLPDGDVLFVGHGGVGTLLLCAIAGYPIDRRHDQGSNGGGNWFSFTRDTRQLLSAWQPMETL